MYRGVGCDLEIEISKSRFWHLVVSRSWRGRPRRAGMKGTGMKGAGMRGTGRWRFDRHLRFAGDAVGRRRRLPKSDRGIETGRDQLSVDDRQINHAAAVTGQGPGDAPARQIDQTNQIIAPGHRDGIRIDRRDREQSTFANLDSTIDLVSHRIVLRNDAFITNTNNPTVAGQPGDVIDRSGIGLASTNGEIVFDQWSRRGPNLDRRHFVALVNMDRPAASGHDQTAGIVVSQRPQIHVRTRQPAAGVSVATENVNLFRKTDRHDVAGVGRERGLCQGRCLIDGLDGFQPNRRTRYLDPVKIAALASRRVHSTGRNFPSDQSAIVADRDNLFAVGRKTDAADSIPMRLRRGHRLPALNVDQLQLIRFGPDTNQTALAADIHRGHGGRAAGRVDNVNLGNLRRRRWRGGWVE